MVRPNTVVCSRPRMVLQTVRTRTAKTMSLMPPATEPGDPPTNMSAMSDRRESSPISTGDGVEARGAVDVHEMGVEDREFPVDMRLRDLTEEDQPEAQHIEHKRRGQDDFGIEIEPDERSVADADAPDARDENIPDVGEHGEPDGPQHDQRHDHGVREPMGAQTLHRVGGRGEPGVAERGDREKH